MTDVDTVVEADKKDAPQWWAVHTIGGREIRFNAPSPEQMMVMRRLGKELESSGDSVSRAIVSMGKVLDAVSACMSSDDERDFVDDLVLGRKIGMEELSKMVRVALMGPNLDKAPAPKNGPAKRARRR